jgi:hypothetical protein
MGCVVCQGVLSESHFANSWEKARKLYPCCSDACARRFDPDVHWLPAARPPPASVDDVVRLSRVSRERLRAGDKPSVVVRDLLIGGVQPRAVRKVLMDVELEAKATDKTMRRLNVLGWISAALTGRLWLLRRKDFQDVDELHAAHAEIAQWTARFGESE